MSFSPYTYAYTPGPFPMPRMAVPPQAPSWGYMPAMPMAVSPAYQAGFNQLPLREAKEVRARHILVKTKQEADRYRYAIISGQQRFEDIAKRVSECPSGKKGGDLGFFERGQMVPEFDKTAFRLPVGVVSEPVKTDFGWHLIQVTERK